MLRRLMMAGGGSPPVGNSSTWDPAVLSTGASLVSGNLRLQASAGTNFSNTRSQKAILDLAYLSCVIGFVSGGDNGGCGIADAAIDFTTATRWVGDGTDSIGVWGPVGVVYVNGVSAGSVGAIASGVSIEFAIRLTSRRVWVRRSGGSWVGGGDPAADTTPTVTLSGSADLHMAASLSRPAATSSRYAQLGNNSAATTGTAPSGFTKANWAP